jgi:hypothetical protein
MILLNYKMKWYKFWLHSLFILTFLFTVVNPSKLKMKMKMKMKCMVKVVPEVNYSIEEIILKKGYSMNNIFLKNRFPLQVHYVNTEDGYILKLFRIYKQNNFKRSSSGKKNVVLLQHGLFV